MNKDQNNLKKGSDSPEIFSAKLAFIGASISTLGDGLQAVAAGIALDLLQRANNESSQNQNEQSQYQEKMQKEIDDLINELKQIKKTMKTFF
jgi:gas vesicle protein